MAKPYTPLPYTTIQNKVPWTGNPYKINGEGALQNWLNLADGSSIENEAIGWRHLDQDTKQALVIGLKGVVDFYSQLPPASQKQVGEMWAVKNTDNANPPNYAGIYVVVEISGTKQWQLALKNIKNHSDLELQSLGYDESRHTGFQRQTIIASRAPTAADDSDGTGGYPKTHAGALWVWDDKVWVCTSAIPQSAQWVQIAGPGKKSPFSLLYTPYALREPSTGAAEVKTITVGGLEWEAAAYDDTATEYLYLQGQIPADSLPDVTLRFVGAAHNNSANRKMRWRFDVWEYGDTSAVSVLTTDRTPPTYTSGQDVAVISTTLSALGLSAGSRFSARISITGPQSGDRVTQDMYLFAFSIEGVR